MTVSVGEILEANRMIVRRRNMEPWVAVWMTAIACHESNYGKALPQGSNNPYGYHWSPNMGWSFVEATEGGTGNRQRYRKFGSLVEAGDAVRYLIMKSGHAAYVEARTNYHKDVGYFIGQYGINHRTGRVLPDLRALWIIEFSLGYCPVDPNHGPRVLSIYQELMSDRATEEEKSIIRPPTLAE